MIKLVYKQKNKIIKDQNRSFQQLRQIIKASFPQAPVDYSLSYIDEDKDQICLNSDQDLKNMFNAKLKTHKVYIKESLSQTLVLDLDRSSQIEVSIDNINPIEKDRFEEKKIELSFLKQEINNQQKQILVSQTVQIEEKEEEKQMEENECKQVSQKYQIQQQYKVENLPIQKIQISEVIVIPTQNLKKVVELSIPVEARVLSKIEQKKKEGNLQKPNVQVEKLFDELHQIQNAKKQQVLHLHEIICSNCKDEFGIIGIRYQCLLCNYVNLCSKCEAEVEHEHALLKIKTPKHAISKETLIQKFRKEIYQPVQQRVIPHDHYVPSINKEDALRVIQYARDAYENGYNKAKQSIEELFTKLQKPHHEPYQAMKPIPSKPHNFVENANYLSQLMGIPFNQAYRFVNKHHGLSRQRIVELYLSNKK